MAERAPADRWLFSHVRDVLLLVDPTGQRVEDANPAARELFGWANGAPLERELDHLVADGSRTQLRAAIEAACGSSVEIALVTQAGEEIPADVVVHRLPTEGLLISICDLRERAQSTARREALLRVARLAAQRDVAELFDALLAEAVVVLHGDDGGIAHWDAHRGELIQVHTFLPSSSAGVVLDPDRSASGRAASQKMPIIINDYQREIGGATPAGRVGANAVVAAPLLYEGRLLGTLSVSRLRQAHPFARADAELLELLASTAAATVVALERARAAEAADRAKSAFLASMSHELRTPLTAILGYSELLLEEAAGRGQSAFVPDLDRIRTSGRDLLGLIDRVLDLTSIESGDLRLAVQRVEVRPLLDEVLGDTVALECGPDLGEIWADPLRLRQMLLTLVKTLSRCGRLSVRAVREPEWLSLHVSAAGVDLAAVGLDLALAQRLCTLMGGSLVAASQPGVGTSYAVRLPVSQVIP